MERAGIEPVTSGLQILSGADQLWLALVGTGRLHGLRLSRVSPVADDGQRDLT
jgi:hypothetical protein